MSQKTTAERVLSAVAKAPGLSRADYAKATRLETAVVGRAFQTLKANKLITMKGDRRGASYILTVKGKKEVAPEVSVVRKTTKKGGDIGEAPKAPTKPKRVRSRKSAVKAVEATPTAEPQA